MRVLLADDDCNFAYVLKKELEEHSFDVDVVRSGLEAIINFIEKKYEFILLEVFLEKHSGLDTLKILNALKTIKLINRNVQIITFSCEDGEKEDEMLCSGSVKYFRKPFNIEFLVTYMKCSMSEEAV